MRTFTREDPEFAARMSAYDTAFKMQTEAPEVFDLSKESKETLDMYGVGQPLTDDYGRRCLLARRMIEKGVRFTCVVSGGGAGNLEWDAHQDIEQNHLQMASWTDKPVAALIKDLKQRGMLDSTIVLWGGEFGRSPESEKSKGRDHHNTGILDVGGRRRIQRRNSLRSHRRHRPQGHRKPGPLPRPAHDNPEPDSGSIRTH